MRPGSRLRLSFPAACALLLLGLRAAAGAPAPKRAESRLGLLVRAAFPQEEIRDAGGDDGDGSYRFQAFDEPHGYARVVGPFGGYQDFFLLRGKPRDHLIAVEYTCAPACSQRVTVSRFDASGAAPEAVPLMDVLELSPFSALRRRLVNLCLDPEGNFDTQPDARDKARRGMPACPFVFSFMKKRSAAVLFKVVDENGSDLMLSLGKTSVAPQLRLSWNGTKLVGAESGDAGPVFLNDDKMRTLF